MAAAKTYDNLDMSLKEANAHRHDWFEGVQKCCKTDTLGNVMEKIAKAEVRAASFYQNPSLFDLTIE